MLTKPSPMAVAASCDACRWACAAWACQANADPSGGVPVCCTTSRRYRFAMIASALAISSCDSMIIFCVDALVSTNSVRARRAASAQWRRVSALALMVSCKRENRDGGTCRPRSCVQAGARPVPQPPTPVGCCR